MPKDLIRYDLLVQNALKGVVRKVLGEVVRDGLPGDHHFYISFRTDEPGARVSNRLREKYPEEMTIVLQHQFWDLGVNDNGFEVGLSFSGVPERLLVPYDAITGFFDPSVQFGLKFEVKDESAVAEALEATDEEPPPKSARGKASEPAEVAALKEPARPDKAPTEVRREKKGKAKAADAAEGKAADAEDGAEVVSLDAFRKKQ